MLTIAMLNVASTNTRRRAELQEVVVEVRRVFLTPDGYYCFAVSLFEPRSIAA